MIGTVLGNRYEIMAELGSGGMAKVYKACCRYLKRFVAVKVLKEEFKDDSEFLKRFETEALAAASLAHPNIVQIYDVGKDNDFHYIVMEYVEGITLKEYIQERDSLDWREAVNIAIQICSAISKAHSRNIIHRDIKPQNIIMTSDGVPKVTDFGIARAASAETATMKIDTVGSVHYSSPEQVRGGYTDEKSDIYSIGVTLFEMITGKLPFDGETAVSVALKHIQDIAPLASEIKQGIPEALNQILAKALAKSKNDRYVTVSEMISDLEHVRNKPEEILQLPLPEMKQHINDEKFATKKMETIGDDELARHERRKTPPGKKGVGKILMPALYVVLIAAIAGGIFFFVQWIIGGLRTPSPDTKDVVVGSYVGRPIDEVLSEIEQNKIPHIVVEEFDESVPANVIINQDPQPESTIKSNGLTTLKLVVSKGQEMIEIKDVKFKEHSSLKYELEDKGLIVHEKSEFSEEVGSNLVTRTDPAAPTSLKRGSEITIYWSAGPEKKEVVVPELVGSTYEEAVSKLLALNLKLGRTFPEGRQGFTGKIIKQAPNNGETVIEDTAIDIYFEDENATSTPTGTDPTGTNTGTNTNTPQDAYNATLTVSLPTGDYGDNVQLRVVIINNTTGVEDVRMDASVSKADFPYPVIVPVPAGGGITAKVFLDGIEKQQQGY